MKISTLVMMASLCMVAASTARAEFIMVHNSSFEDYRNADGSMLADGIHIAERIPDWKIDPKKKGNIGTYNPDSSKFSVAVPDGQNTAYLNAGWIYQDLDATLEAGTYTLSVDVGNRLGTAMPAFNIALRTADNNQDLVSIADVGIPSIADGLFQTVMLSFTAYDDDWRLGKNLRIVLESAGIQTNFDNVQLERHTLAASTHVTPEPSTLAMAASGSVVGLGWYLRRRLREPSSAIGS